ncbi:Sensor histidine kinase ComP [Chryseobacterium aquaeductus]|uniref:histidine kinase n=1 Tax=Chryseobacterium aquaeductus TaxID=2675056 RepID=A0A9N8QQ69_9FLAO|nr:ATP-binding protein [Chryseobacterium aquaeductus]CAA7330281.1 Sensor histidine kinase ComP [Chryseobacterium potabilaquae]CAD7802537.1 Sensor histidine kinase ComP [Chryseobacterium aquaeductus]
MFILLAYKFFIDRIIKEKNTRHEAEILHQKNLVLESTKIQEEERKRMAVLMHDDIGNRLNILSIWVHNLNTENKETAEKIISKQISELIDSARSISHSLYPVNLEKLGLLLYIEELICNLSQTLKINLIVNSHYHKRDIFTEIQLYRIIQEFTTNVIKHSKATEMKIYIKDNKQHIAIVLSDNGNGFDYDSVKKGMGIKNIESRIQSLEAQYKWKNKKGKGSTLIIKIPQK